MRCLPVEVIMQAVEEDAKQGGTERAALSYPILLNAGRPCRTPHLHGERATAVQGLNGCQHPGADPNVSQAAPQELMLHGIVRLLKVYKANVQRPPL